MKKITVLMIILMLTAVGAALAGPPYCAPGQRGDQSIPMHRWWQLPQISEKLDITTAEAEKLDGLYQKTREKLIELAASGEKTMLALEMQLDGKNFDKNDCVNQFQRLQATRTELASVRFQFVLETRDILGQERFNRLKDELFQVLRQEDGYYQPRTKDGTPMRRPGRPGFGQRTCPLY